MNLEEKISKIKKSCNVGEIVTNVLCILAIVGCVLAFIAGGYIFSMGREFDEQMKQAEAAGYVTTGTSIGAVKIADVELIDVSDIETSIPAFEAAIEDHPYCFAYSIFVFTMAVVALLLAIMMKVISKTFALIKNEETPFTDKVIRRVVAVLIAVTVIAALSSGLGAAIVLGIITWVVYTILDYGKLLQIQSDETL